MKNATISYISHFKNGESSSFLSSFTEELKHKMQAFGEEMLRVPGIPVEFPTPPLRERS
jgi:hypothetical protein